jgi:hypothetical protein
MAGLCDCVEELRIFLVLSERASLPWTLHLAGKGIKIKRAEEQAFMARDQVVQQYRIARS